MSTQRANRGTVKSRGVMWPAGSSARNNLVGISRRGDAARAAAPSRELSRNLADDGHHEGESECHGALLGASIGETSQIVSRWTRDIRLTVRSESPMRPGMMPAPTPARTASKSPRNRRRGALTRHRPPHARASERWNGADSVVEPDQGWLFAWPLVEGTVALNVWARSRGRQSRGTGAANDKVVAFSSRR